MISLLELVSEDPRNIQRFLTQSNIPVQDSLTENLYRIAHLFDYMGKLNEDDKKYLSDTNLWTYLHHSKNKRDGFIQWLYLQKARKIVLYVNPKDVSYLDTVKVKLLSAGIRIISRDAPVPHRDEEVFYLVQNLEGLESDISKYGVFCTIIAIDDVTMAMGVKKGVLTPEYFTVTCYSPEWLEEYLLKTYPENLQNLTYTVSGFSGIVGGYLHLLMRGWKLVYNPAGFIDYLSHNTTTSGLRSKALNRVPSGMRNVCDTETTIDITDKAGLYQVFMQLDPNQKVVLPSKDLEDTDTMESLGMGDVLIIRPVGVKAFQGRGIEVVTNNDELIRARETLKKNPDWTKATVSPYIKNPMLYDGRKLHLRQLMLVTSWGTTSLYDRADGTLALLPYKQGNWLNKDIHDTHLSSTDKYIVFPDYFSENVVGKMKEGIQEIFRLLTRAIQGKPRSYPESDYGFDALGLDIMFEPDGSAILIEVNTNAGFNVIFEENNKDLYFYWYNRLNEWLYKNTISSYIETTTPIALQAFEISSDEDLQNLSIITSVKNIMGKIGKGGTWDFQYLKKISNSAKTEILNKKYYDWIVKRGSKVVGYVSIRPLDDVKIPGIKSSEPQIRILIGEQGQGYGIRALAAAVREYWRLIGKRVKIWAVVKVENRPSVKFFESKAGWKKERSMNVFGANHILYSTE